MQYTLDTDPWWPSDLEPIARPSYQMGRYYGLAGCAYIVACRVPSFPSHDAAIRATLDPNWTPPMPDLNRHVSLTAADVTDLRVSARAHVFDSGAAASALVIAYNAASDMYELRRGPGTAWLAHKDIGVIAALVRGERFEPGFIRRVLDASYQPDELALDADAREQLRRDRAAAAASSRARAREEEERKAAQRRSTPLSDCPDDLTAEDLFNTL